MKKIIYCFVLIALFGSFFLVNGNAENGNIVYAETDNITGYREKLAYINQNYGEEFLNRIIVKTNREIEDKDAIYSASGFAGLNILQYENAEDASFALEYYQSLPYVEYAEQDVEIKIDDLVSYDDNFSIEGLEFLSWGSDLLGVSTYQNYILEKQSENLEDIYVAVLDTGIDTDNEFLQGRIAYDLGISYYDSELYLSSESEYVFEDDNSHGTHVAGTIVDLTLDNVKIIPIKVLNSSGSGSNANVISGIEYVLSLKNSGTNICAFNMSLGGFGYSQQEEEAINNCYDANIMPVVAAGNDNYYAEEFTPASCEKALTISALSQNEYYENFPYVANYSNYGEVVDLCLPGTDILSCVPDESTYEKIYTSSTGGKYAVISGTSMATPHATALVALFATFYGEEYDVRIVESEIKENAYDFGDVGKDDLYGYGVPSLVLAIDEYELNEMPTLSEGVVNSSYNFEGTLSVEIYNNNPQIANYTYKIYYTLDGSYPTLINHIEYSNPITISESTLLRFVIYLFDDNGNVCGDSKLYEATFYKGNPSANIDGTGFEITEDGVVTKYNSGIRNIILPEYINGVKVNGLAKNLFYGLNIESFVCDFDISVGYYPFVSCGSLKAISIASSEAEYLAKYCFALKEIDLPNVTEIREGVLSSSSFFGFYGGQTFVGCFNLESLTAPKVTEIKDNVFSGFKRLKEVNIDWSNLYSIGEYAFDSCTSLTIDVVVDNLTTIGKKAFYNSGINSFHAEKLEVLSEQTFCDCLNLQSLHLPNIRTIYPYAIFGCNNLQYIFIGDNVLQLYADSFTFSYLYDFTIYCYDKEYVSGFTDQEIIDISPNIEEVDGNNISIDITGYNLTLKIFRSADENLSDDDVLVNSNNFDGLNINKNYNFSYLSNNEHYYIITLSDYFGNIDSLSLTRTGEQEIYDIVVESNIENFGIYSSSYCYCANEMVELSLNAVTGYELVSLTLDNEDILNEFVDGKYSFIMPNRNIELNLIYEPIKYNITLNIVGDGEATVVDEYGDMISSANYNQMITLNYSSENSYVAEIYYQSNTSVINKLLINEASTSFVMPAMDIDIYIVFKQVTLSNFLVSYNSSNFTFSISSYYGTDVVVKIPQYVTNNGMRYRINKIYDYCFYGNTTLEQVEVQFLDQNRDIEVGNNAFGDCVNLRYVNIGNIISVSDRAFSGCSSLVSVDLGSCKTVGEWAFYKCYSLTSIDLSSCTEIYRYVFSDCYALKNVVLSDDLTYIPDIAFKSCSSLENIDLSNVQKIGNRSFYGCKSLSIINLSSFKEFYSSEGDETGYSFYMCTSLTEVIGSENLKIIPSHTFASCYNLEKFDFSNCEELGEYAFFNNGKLNYIDLRNIKKIEGYPFSSASATRFIFGSNEYLLTSDELELSFFIRYAYVDKDYSGEIGTYMTNRFSYTYSLGDYIVYSVLSSYYVTFKFENGTIIEQELYSAGTNIVFPTQFKDNICEYEFINWKNEKTSEIVNPSDEVTTYADVVFIANTYTPNYRELRIVFYYGYDYDGSGIVNDEGDIFYSVTYQYGEKINPLTTLPNRNADAQATYAFKNWSYNNTSYGNDALPVASGDMEFVAVYETELKKYIISWYDGNGILIYQEELEYGVMPEYSSHIVPTKISPNSNYVYYSFIGWSPTINVVTMDCEYVAQFELNFREYIINYYYGFDYDKSGTTNDEGDLYQKVIYTFYDTIENAECDYCYIEQGVKYSFSKWSTNFADGVTIDMVYPLFSENWTLNIYAQYDEEVVLYSIRWFDGQGEIIYTDFLHYGDFPVYNFEDYGEPFKDSTNYYNYKFLSWDKEIVEVTENVDYYAEFAEYVRLYEITWLDGDGEVIYTEELPYESVIDYDESTYGTPTKPSTDYYRYEFVSWSDSSENEVVRSDKTMISEFVAYNIVDLVDDDYQLVDVSALSAINSVKINLNDIIENGVLEIKFNNSSILFDQSKHEFFDNADVLELKAYLNYDTESNGNFSKLWSLNIEMFLDGLQISSINNDIEIDLICSTQENAKLQLNDNDIEFTLQNDNSISFKTNQLGNFVYGYENTDNTIIIVLLVCGSLLLISGIVCFVIFKWRRKKIKSTN